MLKYQNYRQKLNATQMSIWCPDLVTIFEIETHKGLKRETALFE